jgi:3-methylcrotonyl-CoA carboxylase alpha subunit
MQGFLVIGETAHPVALEPASGGGRRLPTGKLVALGPVGPDGAAQLTVGERAYRIHLARDGERTWVHLAGRTFEITWRSAIDHLGRTDDPAADRKVIAPMPGSVVGVLAPVGTKVAKGQPLIVIESMKLETTLRAPCDGVLVTVLASDGEAFGRDAILAEIEPED